MRPSVPLATGVAIALVGTVLLAMPTADAARTAPSLDVVQLKKLYIRPGDVPFPKDNPRTEASVELGRTLFFDPRLSGSNWISCATCHNPAMAWGDGLPRGIGHGMKEVGRRTPTVLNLAWTTSMFWDGRMATLEQQALGPIEAAGEMALPLDQLDQRIQGIDSYAPLFEAAYPGEPIGRDTIAKALANFQRTIVSGEAPFDRWIQGDEDALSNQAKRGFEVFHEADCHQCHSGWRFTDDGFYDIGIDDEDVGRGAVIPIAAMQHTFKTPTLREVSLRYPYMHAGSEATLADVVAYYNDGGTSDRPSKSMHVRELHLSEADQAALVSFLETLTGPVPTVEVPSLPR